MRPRWWARRVPDYHMAWPLKYVALRNKSRISYTTPYFSKDRWHQHWHHHRGCNNPRRHSHRAKNGTRHHRALLYNEPRHTLTQTLTQTHTRTLARTRTHRQIPSWWHSHHARHGTHGTLAGRTFGIFKVESSLSEVQPGFSSTIPIPSSWTQSPPRDSTTLRKEKKQA